MLPDIGADNNIYLSPHYDDIAFSLGARVAAMPGGRLVNLFTRSGYVAGTPAEHWPDAETIARVMVLRRHEDMAFSERHRLERLDLGFDEPPVRRRSPWDLGGLADDIAQARIALTELLLALPLGARIFCPAGIGGHVNPPAVRGPVVELLPALAQLAGVVAGQEEETRVAITLTDTGADVDLEGNERALSAAARAKIGEITGAARMARVSVGGVPVIERQAPVLHFAGKAVTPPPGAFLQAVPEAEQAMIDLVTTALGKAKQVGDLFCGLGTLTLPIAQKARVTAFDADRNAIAALNEAQRKNQGLKPFTAKPRDLFRDALSPMEMKDLDAVVLDPPRAGAKAQCERLAQSKVKRVVMVSCNPATLARDLRILIDGGYRLDAITPIDQFLYSPHLEAVAALTR